MGELTMHHRREGCERITCGVAYGCITAVVEDVDCPDCRRELGPTPVVQVTEYTVCLLPGDDINHHSFAITVAYRGRGLWAVSRHRQCLGRDGEWDWESLPSERTDEWLAEHRFPVDKAIQLAKQEAPRITVNGMSAAEVLARTGGR